MLASVHHAPPSAPVWVPVALSLLVACTGAAQGDTGRSSDLTCSAEQVLDEGVCVPAACGVGAWGDVPVDGGNVYVKPDAADGGDGSEAAPVGSVQVAVDLAADHGGGTVVLAGGTYAENVALGSGHDQVRIRGRCKDLVTIDGSSGDGTPTLEVIGVREAPEVSIDGLTIRGGPHSGLWVENASVTLSDSDLRENVGVGVLVLAGAASLDHVDVHDTLPNADGAYGRGLNAQEGSTLTATDCTVSGSTEVGIYAANAGTRVDLTDTEVSGVNASPNGDGGGGVAVLGGAVLTATRVSVQDCASAGVAATDVGTAVTLLDTSVAGCEGGIAVQYGAALTATGCALQGNVQVGVDARDEGTAVQLVGTGILDTSVDANGEFGFGLEASGGAALGADGCTVQGNHSRGVYASGVGTAVTLSDTQVLDTDPSPGLEGDYGFGIQADGGATVSMSGGMVSGNTATGVIAGGAGTLVELVDATVLGTRRGRQTGFAPGLGSQDSAVVRATRCDISGNAGPGVYVVAGGQLEAEQTVITGNRFAGVVVLRGAVSLVGSTISDTLPDEEWGGGLGVYGSARFGAPTIDLLDSTVGPHDYAGLWLDGPGNYLVEGNLLSGSGGLDMHGHTLHGNAVFAEGGVGAPDGTAGLRLARNTFDGAEEIAVLLDSSTASLDGNTWSASGLNLRQQSCGATTPLTEAEPDWAEDWVVCTGGNVLTAYDLDFTTMYLREAETSP